MTMLRTACILRPPAASDGHRFSTMSRHTLNDGKTPDARIIEGESFDFHAIRLAPPSKLVGEWYKGALTWEEFDIDYRLHLFGEWGTVCELARYALTHNVTLLCIEDSPHNCHRSILATVCKEIEPNLEVKIA